VQISVKIPSVLVVNSIFLLMLCSCLRAQEARLSFEPEKPVRGSTVLVEYRPEGALARERILNLRALYSAGQPTRRWTAHVTRLERGPGGVFHGRFVLPDSAVCALLSIEDTSGVNFDSNAGNGWHALAAHTNAGYPEPKALEELAAFVVSRDSRASHAFARELARLYPSRVESWTALHFYESLALGAAGAEPFADEHRTRLAEFHNKLANASDVPPDEQAAMYWYAAGVKDTVIARHWQDRLEREHPKHPQAVQLRVAFGIAKEHRGDPAGGLAAAEGLWNEVGSVHPMLLQYGIRQAEMVGDSRAIMRWAKRTVESDSTSYRAIASRLSEIGELRDTAIVMLRATLERLDTTGQTGRGIFTTRAERKKEIDRARRRVLAALGNAKIAQGALLSGLDTLELAVHGSWDRSLLRNVARARLAHGDTTTALHYLAKAAADPAESPALVDSARVLANLRVGPEHWQELVADAQRGLREYVLRESTRRSPAPVRMLDAAGKERWLVDVIKGSPSLVILSSRFCSPAVAALPEVVALSKSAQKLGVNTVVVIDETPSAEAVAWLQERGITGPIFFDVWRDAFRSIGRGGTPEYYVMDSSAVIRFENYGSVSDIPRQLMALLSPH
jgi:hypothetical protein